MRNHLVKLLLVAVAALLLHPLTARTGPPVWLQESSAKLEQELVARHGEAQRARLRRGLEQVGRFWRTDDGDTNAFETFVRLNFAGDQPMLDTVFNRFQHLFEMLDGHMTELRYELRLQTDLDLGANSATRRGFRRLRTRRPSQR